MAQVEAAFAKAFDRFDRDHSGSIDKCECRYGGSVAAAGRGSGVCVCVCVRSWCAGFVRVPLPQPIGVPAVTESLHSVCGVWMVCMSVWRRGFGAGTRHCGGNGRRGSTCYRCFVCDDVLTASLCVPVSPCPCAVCVCVAAELSALCASLGASLAPADLDDALVKLDKDGSGRIEKGEFMGWWTARSGGADLDGDGRVDAVESQLVRRPAARCVCVSVCLCVCVSVSVCLCVQTCGHDMCSFLLYFCVGFRASRLTQPPPFAYVRPG